MILQVHTDERLSMTSAWNRLLELLNNPRNVNSLSNTNAITRAFGLKFLPRGGWNLFPGGCLEMVQR